MEHDAGPAIFLSSSVFKERNFHFSRITPFNVSQALSGGEKGGEKERKRKKISFSHAYISNGVFEPLSEEE